MPRSSHGVNNKYGMLIKDLFEGDELPRRLKLSGDWMSIPMDGGKVVEPPRKIVISGRPTGDTPANMFMRELIDGTQQSMFNPKLRTYGMAMLDIRPGFDAHTVHLSDIQSHVRGEGTKAMDYICALADAHGVTIELTAMGYGKTPTPRLVRWYQGFGFHPLDPNWENHLQPPRPRDSIDVYTPDSVDMVRDPQ